MNKDPILKKDMFFMISKEHDYDIHIETVKRIHAKVTAYKYVEKDGVCSEELQQRLDFIHLVLSNAIWSYRSGRGLSIPTTENPYHYSIKVVSRYFKRNLMEFLRKEACSDFVKGFYFKDQKRIRLPVWQFDQRIYNLIGYIPDDQSHLLTIRQGKSRRNVEFFNPMTEHDRWAEGILKIFQMNLNSGAVKLADGSRPKDQKPTQKFIYSDEFGGRIYYGLQYLPKKERQGITIDGEETVEIDIHAESLSILRALSDPGFSYNDWEDDAYGYYKGNLKRDVVKTATAIMFNAYRPYKTMVDKRQGSPLKMECTEAKDLINTVQEVYPFVKDFLGSGIGYIFQSIEGMVNLRLLELANSRGDIILTIHDGIRVKKSQREFYETMMEKIWKEEVGFIRENMYMVRMILTEFKRIMEFSK